MDVYQGHKPQEVFPRPWQNTDSLCGDSKYVKEIRRRSFGQFDVQTIKIVAQSLLQRLGLYHRAKASTLYDCYWWIADKKIIDQRRREVDFYRELLAGFQPGNLVFDIGANHGSKTDVFLRLGARVIALEPDELNKEILRRRFLEYRFTKKPVVIVPKAVSDSQTVETIWIDAPGSAKNSLSRKWVEILRGDKERFWGESEIFSKTQG